MRTYYIYVQKLEKREWGLLQWTPFECIGVVEGTRELYEYFHKKHFPYREWGYVKSFQYSSRKFTDSRVKEIYYWDFIYTGEIRIYAKYLIKDNKGRIRDYYELTRQYIKMRHGRIKDVWQKHYIHDIRDRRLQITPDDKRELKNQYGIVLPEYIHKEDDYEYWSKYSYRKISKSWKDQSKRKKQWRERNVN